MLFVLPLSQVFICLGQGLLGGEGAAGRRVEYRSGYPLSGYEPGPGAGPLLMGSLQHRGAQDTGSTGTRLLGSIGTGSYMLGALFADS